QVDPEVLVQLGVWERTGGTPKAPSGNGSGSTGSGTPNGTGGRGIELEPHRRADTSLPPGWQRPVVPSPAPVVTPVPGRTPADRRRDEVEREQEGGGEQAREAGRERGARP